jgi:hypothetical protein
VLKSLTGFLLLMRLDYGMLACDVTSACSCSAGSAKKQMLALPP